MVLASRNTDIGVLTVTWDGSHDANVVDVSGNVVALINMTASNGRPINMVSSAIAYASGELKKMDDRGTFNEN